MVYADSFSVVICVVAENLKGYSSRGEGKFNILDLVFFSYV